MKTKLFYFWEEHQSKIFLTVIIILFIILTIFIYGACISSSSEVYKDKSPKEDIILTKEEEKEKENVVVKTVYVDIKGEIKSPGVYLIEEGKRIKDAIEKAGGLTENADTSVNNLSRKVSDEMVIIIYSKEQVENFKTTKKEEEELLNGINQKEENLDNNAVIKEEEIDTKPPTPKEESTSSNQNLKVSINKAGISELTTLPGIGESKAQAIISYRNEHGKFKNLEQLLEVTGIGEAIFAKIKDLIQL